MEELFLVVAKHGGPEWLLVIWLLWRIERLERFARARSERDAALKHKIAEALRNLAAQIRRGE